MAKKTTKKKIEPAKKPVKTEPPREEKRTEYIALSNLKLADGAEIIAGGDCSSLGSGDILHFLKNGDIREK